MVYGYDGSKSIPFHGQYGDGAGRGGANGSFAADAVKGDSPAAAAGWEARFVEVNFPAGVPSVAPKHPGFVLGYVTEGEFRFGLNDETPSVLAAGQAFYEPSGAKHTGGDSANPQWGARILPIIIAPVEKK